MYRRFRQHIKQLSGGAHYTSCIASDDQWIPVVQINGFQSEKQALQFEYAMKQKMASYRNQNLSQQCRKKIDQIYNESVQSGTSRGCSRIVILLQCLCLAKWTVSAICSKEIPLQIVWYSSQYRPMNISHILSMLPHITEIFHDGVVGNKVTIFESQNHKPRKEICIKIPFASSS